MRKLVFFILLACLASSVFAEEVFFTFKDVNTRENISDVIIYAISQNSTTEFVEENGGLTLNFPPGRYEVSFLIDDLSTKGQDYFGKFSSNANISNQTVSVFPVGTLRGIVRDALDNVVNLASLKFDCRTMSGTDFPETADKYGSFYIETMPVGPCKIYSTYLNAVGVQDITINRGDLIDLELRLDKTIVAQPKPIPTYAISLLIIVLGIVIWLIWKRASKPVKEVKETGKRAHDVLSTLNSKERDVINYLQANKDRATQADIRHNTSIPRTSLARVLQNLESKNIITVRKVGKAVKVQLTDWFLGK